MPITISKLPENMRAEWGKLERNSACTFKDLLDFIDEEAEGQEYAALIGGATHKHKFSETSSRQLRFSSTHPADLIERSTSSMMEVIAASSAGS